MLGRLVLIAVALGAAGLLCLPMVSGRRAAGKPVVTESETVCAPEAMGGSQAYRKTVQSAFVPSTAAVSQADRETVRTTFGKLPLYFVENQGVYPGEVAFTIQGADKTLFFTPGGITMRLRGEEPQDRKQSSATSRGRRRTGRPGFVRTSAWCTRTCGRESTWSTAAP